MDDINETKSLVLQNIDCLFMLFSNIFLHLSIFIFNGLFLLFKLRDLLASFCKLLLQVIHLVFQDTARLLYLDLVETVLHKSYFSIFGGKFSQ